jgi:hypothetical protein
MRRLLSILAVLGLLCVSLPLTTATTNAAAPGLFDVCKPGTQASTSAACSGRKSGTDNPIAGPNGIIVSITNVVALVAGSAATVLLIIAGIKYITSHGDSAGVKAAKDSITNILIGIIVIILGHQIIVFVVSKL